MTAALPPGTTQGALDRAIESTLECKHGVSDEQGDCRPCKAEALRNLRAARRAHREAQQSGKRRSA
jgi:hypothetical protein